MKLVFYEDLNIKRHFFIILVYLFLFLLIPVKILNFFNKETNNLSREMTGKKSEDYKWFVCHNLESLLPAQNRLGRLRLRQVYAHLRNTL